MPIDRKSSRNNFTSMTINEEATAARSSAEPNLIEGLYEFFSKSSVSSAVVLTLSREQRPLYISEIHATVKSLRGEGVPEVAVECSLLLLRDTHVIVSNNGEEAWSLTETGRALAERLGSRET